MKVWYLYFFFFLLLLLLLAARIPHSSSDPTDQVCLRGLSQVVWDPEKRLQNWTEPLLTTPCDGLNTALVGATCNNGRVFKLNLAGLGIGGTISPLISNCTYLQSLDLSSNSLSGPIPEDLHLLLNLAVLNLSGNSLSGEIPPQLSSCPYLNVIDLHSNHLSGGIPPELGFLSRLSILDLSGNHLSGSIPPSVADRFNASSFEGNSRLYGYPLPGVGGRGGGGRLSAWSIAAIALGSGLTSLVLSLTVVCRWMRGSEEVGNEEEEDGGGGFGRSH